MSKLITGIFILLGSIIVIIGVQELVDKVFYSDGLPESSMLYSIVEKIKNENN